MRKLSAIFFLLCILISVSAVQAVEVTRITLTGSDQDSSDILEIQFSGGVDPASFTLIDDVSFAGSSGPVTPDVQAWLTGSLLRLTFTAGLAADVYDLSVGPQIASASDGGLMDQDGDGNAGEPVEDAYNATIFTSTMAISSTDNSHDGLDLVIRGVTVTIDGVHSFNALQLREGAVLTHSATTAEDEFRMDLTLSGGLLIDETSSINVIGRGYLPGYTHGNTTEGGATGATEGDGSGGSYGGLGGGGTPNWTYGDFTNPNELGSGGSRTGSGGGLVRITAGEAEINGSIRADGTEGYRGTGGSGGGIRLDVGTLSGSGLITANGGGLGSAFQCGGGGRIAIYADAFDGFDYTIQVTAHGGINSPINSGATGTLYVVEAGGIGELRIDAHGGTNGQWTPLGQLTDSVVTVGKLVVAGSATAAPDHEIVITAETVSLEDGGLLTHRNTDASATYALRLTATTLLSIDSTSSINVTGRGYLPGYTYGNTTDGGAVGDTEADGSGGSYGGLGGGGTPNWAYGDYADPNELGSGGSRTGSGGGLVRITAGAAEINGSIRTDGTEGYRGTGGSGGGIRLDVGTLSGSGLITANGGGLGSAFQCGSGGRIAIYADAFDGFDYTTQVTAHGGVNSGSNSGATGTLYVVAAGGVGELRIDAHGTTNGQWTPLGQTTDAMVTVGKLVVAGGATAAPDHDIAITAETVSLEDGGLLTHRYTDASATYALRLTATTLLTIDSTSSINVTGRGYLPGYTYGNTTDGGAVGDTEGDGSGGSYGGLGGGGTPNWTYGNHADPNELGSGGSRTGSGGGLVRITAGEAEINGSIRADGTEGYRGTGGSGGGIRLDVGTLSGSGMITANGGGLGSAFQCGSGGRIAIFADVFDGFNYTTQAMAHGGVNSAANSGATGTLYVVGAGGAGELRIDSHGESRIQWTPLGLASDSQFRVDRMVLSGATVASMNGIPIIADSISLEEGGVLTHMAATDRTVFGLRVIAKEMMAIDATSAVDVSGRGYPTGRSKGNVYVGGAGTSSGGSYGGLGAGPLPGDIYGHADIPEAPGAGGSGSLNMAGGGFLHITTSALENNGAIRADGTGSGYYGLGAGSGGGILINTGTLSGSGTIEADGGTATYSGGGGRIAVYTWNKNSFPESQIHADGVSQATDGTVHVDAGFRYAWLGTDRTIFHDTECLNWASLGTDPLALTAKVTATCNGVVTTIGTWPAEKSAAVWDTATVSDGLYSLAVRFFNEAGVVVGSAIREIVINNALTWHTGYIEADETWEAGTVHAVDGVLTIAPGVTLTIEAGAVVKFTLDGGIVVSDGAHLNLEGEALTPTYLTSIRDDALGADDNQDGNDTVPSPGDWIGFYLVGTGSVTQTDHVTLTYMFTTHAGTISENQVWRGAQSHHVTADIVIASGVTLTIEPGAVIKFADLAGIVVQSGGTLTAEGNVAQPIIFTSEKDDVVGGDTNGDGSDTLPAAGDWRWIQVQDGGAARLNNTRMSYGGGTGGAYSYNGTLRTDTGAALTVENSLIQESFYEGVVANGGDVTLINTIITATDRAVNAAGNSTFSIVNCTIDDNRIGIWEHGGSISLINTIVSNSSETGVIEVFSTPISLSHCNVWSASGTNYANMADPTGTNGNISADPLFKDRVQGNYRFTYVSPCIDAADGGQAPVTDSAGAPRYDDPRSDNSGIRTGDGAYADMGAFEFVETAESNIDIVVNWIRGPSQVTAGEDVTVSWMITNIGSETAVGPWHDLVQLSPAETYRDVAALEAGSSLNSGNIGPGRSHTYSATVTVPGGTEGTWYWQVRANAAGELFEGTNIQNNNGPLSDSVELAVPSLTVDGSVEGAFGQVGDALWYVMVQSAGQEVLITLDLTADSGRTTIYAGVDTMPTAIDFEYKSNLTQRPDNRLVLPAPDDAQTVYLLIIPEALSGGSQAYTLSAAAVGFNLESVGVAGGGNIGTVSVPLIGSGFDSSMTAAMICPGAGESISAERLVITDSGHALATFDLTGLAANVCDVSATLDGDTVTLDDAFTITAGQGGQLEAHLVMPDTVRIGRPFGALIEYTNIGDADLPIPMLIVAGHGTQYPVWDEGQDEAAAGERLRYLGAPEQGRSNGVLYPGETHTIRFFTKTLIASADYVLFVVSGTSSEPVDWASVSASFEPSDADAAWYDRWEAFAGAIGETWGDFVGYLAVALDQARQFGLAVSRLVTDIFDYILDRNNSIAPDANVVGTLYTEDTDHPTGEASVTLVNQEDENEMYAVETWYDGSFGLSGVPAGTYDVYVGDDLSNPVTEVTVPSVGELSGLQVVEDRGAQVSGRVIDAAGRIGISAARLTAASLDGAAHYTATTDSDGYFSMMSMSSDYYEIYVTAEGRVDARTFIFDLEDEETFNIIIEMEEAGGIAGQVLDGNGDPIPAATVMAQGQSIVQSVEADGQGFYQIGSLPEGGYMVEAAADGYTPGILSGVAVVAGGISTNHDFALTTGNSRLVVTVLDAEGGQGIAGAALACDAAGFRTGPVTTDNSGMVTTPYISHGDYKLWVHADGYLAQKVDIIVAAEEDAPVTIELAKAGVVSAAVTRSDGDPMEGMAISLYNEEGVLVGGYTDQNGALALENLPLGTYILLLYGADVATIIDRTTFTLSAGNTSYTYDKQLSFADVGGVVRASDGSVLQEVAVYLYKNGTAVAKTFSNSSGRYRFLVLETGVYDIFALDQEAGFMQRVGVNLDTNTDANGLNLSPDSTGSCRVRVQSASGSGISDALVSLSLDQSGELSHIRTFGRSLADGSITFSHLPDGVYTVSAWIDGSTPFVRDILVASGQGEIEFTAQSGRTLSGIVRTPAGDAVGCATVTAATIANETVFSTVTNSDGQYEIDGLPADECSLWVSHFYFGSQIVSGINLAGSAGQVVDVIVRQSAGAIEGVVSGPDGAPVAGARVSAMDLASLPLQSEVTGPMGTYHLTGLPQEELIVTVSGNQYTMAGAKAVPSSGTATHVDFVVDAPVAMAIEAEDTSGITIQFTGLIPPVSPHTGEPIPFPSIKEWWFHTGELPPPERHSVDIYAWRHLFETYTNPECPDLGKKEWEDCLDSLAALNDAFDRWVEAYRNYKSTSDATMGLVMAKSALIGTKAFLALANIANSLKGVESGFDHLNLSPESQNALSDSVDFILGAVESIAESMAKGDMIGADFAIGNVLKPGLMHLGNQANLALAYEKAADIVDGKRHFMKIEGVASELADATAYSALMQLYSLYETVDSFIKLFYETEELLDDLSTIDDVYAAAQDIYYSALQRHQRNMALYKLATEGDCCTSPPCPPDRPDIPPKDHHILTGIASGDPNDKYTLGEGPEGWIARGVPILYTIYYENVATATAAAQHVTVTDVLDENLDLATLELIGIGFNNVNISIPSGLQSYTKSAVVVGTDTYPVRIAVALDPDARTLIWDLSSYDILTGQLPEDPFAGFLPPNDDTGKGEGYVSFMVYPVAGLGNGDEVRNQATIVFDENDPIVTSEALNTIDTERPSCVVAPLADSVSNTTFAVHWEGDDADGSGAVNYNVYVSTNGGGFAPWLEETAGTSANFTGQDGDTYAFYCTAEDAAGLEQIYQAEVQAQTVIHSGSGGGGGGSGGGGGGGGCFISSTLRK